jgi:hypothetical protein
MADNEIQKVLDTWAEENGYTDWRQFEQMKNYDSDQDEIFDDERELASLAFAQGKLAERKEITELMEDILSQACYEKDEKEGDVFFSRALSAYADGLEWLVSTGKYEHVYKPVGRMVKIRLKSQLSETERVKKANIDVEIEAYHQAEKVVFSKVFPQKKLKDSRGEQGADTQISGKVGISRTCSNLTRIPRNPESFCTYYGHECKCLEKKKVRA